MSLEPAGRFFIFKSVTVPPKVEPEPLGRVLPSLFEVCCGCFWGTLLFCSFFCRSYDSSGVQRSDRCRPYRRRAGSGSGSGSHVCSQNMKSFRLQTEPGSRWTILFRFCILVCSDNQTVLYRRRWHHQLTSPADITSCFLRRSGDLQTPQVNPDRKQQVKVWTRRLCTKTAAVEVPELPTWYFYCVPSCRTAVSWFSEVKICCF